MRKILLAFISCIFLSACNETEQRETVASDPLIGVVFENGEKAYTSEEFAKIIVSGSVSSSNVPVSTYAELPKTEESPEIAEPSRSTESFESTNPLHEDDPNQSEQTFDPTYTGETIQDITDKTSILAVYAISMRTILNEYLGNNYDANFGYDSGVINIPKDQVQGNIDVSLLEKKLNEAAEQSGLSGYHTTVNLTDSDTANIPSSTLTGWDKTKYAINTESNIFHISTCSTLKNSADSLNIIPTSLSYEELSSQYDPCGVCLK